MSSRFKYVPSRWSSTDLVMSAVDGVLIEMAPALAARIRCAAKTLRYNDAREFVIGTRFCALAKRPSACEAAMIRDHTDFVDMSSSAADFILRPDERLDDARSPRLSDTTLRVTTSGWTWLARCEDDGYRYEGVRMPLPDEAETDGLAATAGDNLHSWIMTAPVLSTRHLDRDTMTMLEDSNRDDGVGSVAYAVSLPEGVLVYHGEEADELGVVSACLKQCLEWSIRHGHAWCRFDPDGDVIASLPVYDW